MRNTIEINPKMLTWAIDRAGHNLDNFLIENPAIKNWIEGIKSPTVKQLERFSKKVHLPFGYLFLDSPPEEHLPIPFFRSNARTEKVSINVYDTILLLQQRPDGKAAQMFTIVHELAHIWTGHSAGFDFRKLQPADDPIEKLCDQVAAEFLVPANLFNNAWLHNSNIRALSRLFKVSEIVIARRALDTGKINKTQFFEFYEEYKKREFEKKEGQPTGGNFYATTRKRISLTFASHVNQAVKSGQLLYRDTYKLTSMKGNTYENFFAINL